MLYYRIGNKMTNPKEHVQIGLENYGIYFVFFKMGKELRLKIKDITDVKLQDG